MKCFGIIRLKQERWNDSFWHFPVEIFFKIWNVHVEQLDFNKTEFLELYSILLKRFWAAVGGACLCVCLCKLTFQRDEGYQAC